MRADPQKASDPKSANHHWFPFLRYSQKCAEEGKQVTVNEWLIATGKVRDFKEENRIRAETLEKAKAEAEATAKAEAKNKGEDEEKANVKESAQVEESKWKTNIQEE